MSEEDRDRLGPIVIAGLLALLGTLAGGLVRGYWDTTLAQHKFQADLVMLALNADSAVDRKTSLGFMMKTGLIDQSAFGGKLHRYLAEHDELPQIRSSGISFSAGVAIPSTSANSSHTDFRVSACRDDTVAAKAEVQANAVVASLVAMGRHGQITKAYWDRTDEISVAELRDKVTIVLDRDRGENRERDRVRTALLKDASLPNIVDVANEGKTNPWQIDIVVCPSAG